MGVLSGLVNEIQKGPEPEKPTRQSPASSGRATPAPKIESEPDAGDEPVRFRRPRPFPDYVRKLWGKVSNPPDYVDYVDGIWMRAGSWSRPHYELIEQRGKPIWLACPLPTDPQQPTMDDDARGTPNMNVVCYYCGRRLHYRTSTGAEFCACCHPIPAVKFEPVGDFSDSGNSPSGGSELSFDNVEFFLKPGLGPKGWEW